MISLPLSSFQTFFFTSWQKKSFSSISVDSSVVRMAESTEVIGLVEAEDLKPNDLVGVNKEPLHVLAVVFFCHSPSPFFQSTMNSDLLVQVFFFAVTFWVV